MKRIALAVSCALAAMTAAAAENGDVQVEKAKLEEVDGDCATRADRHQDGYPAG